MLHRLYGSIVPACACTSMPFFFYFFKEGHAYRNSARPQRKHAKPRQKAPPPKRRAGKGAYDSAARSHASKQDARIARNVEIRKSTQRTNAGNVWLGSNAPTIPVGSSDARQGGRKVMRPGRSSRTLQAQQGARQAGSSKLQQAPHRDGGNSNTYTELLTSPRPNKQRPYNLAPATCGRYRSGARRREGASCGARPIQCLRWGAAQDAQRSSAA